MAGMMLVGAAWALMIRSIRWLQRSCIHILRAVYRLPPPLVYQEFHTSWYYLEHSILPAVFRPLYQAVRTSWYYLEHSILPAVFRPLYQAVCTSWYYLEHSVLPAVFRPMYQAYRTSRYYLGRVLQLAFKIFRVLKLYIGLLITIIYKIILQAVFRPLYQAVRTSWYYLEHSILPAVFRPLYQAVHTSWYYLEHSILPAAFRPLYQAYRTSRYYLGRVLQLAFKIFRVLKLYIGLLITIIYKIIQFIIYLIKRLLPWSNTDDNELVAIASAKPRGLHNLGNTCYFNSVMQPLCHTHILRESLRQSATDGDLIETLRDFYSNMLSGKSGSFSPKTLHKIFCRESSRFDNRRQHDSHECLRHLLDNIRKEERRYLEKTSFGNRGNNLTVVDRVFGGHLITVYICMACQGPYHVFEPCLDISLPICFETLKVGALNKTGKDVPITEADKGQQMNEDETSNYPELEQTCKDELVRTKNSEGENNDAAENESIDEDTDEEEEEKEEDDKEKMDAKRKKYQTVDKVIEVQDNESGCDEGIEEWKDRKRRKIDENMEIEARAIGTEEEKEQDEEYRSKKEEDIKAVRPLNEPKLKEEHIEEKEKDEALKHTIADITPDEEEKHVTEEKHENEKLQDDKYISRKDKNKGKRRKNRGKQVKKSSARKEQGSPKIENNDWKLKPNDCNASVRKQERMDAGRTTGGIMTESHDEERCKENDLYKNVVSSLMRPLSTCSNPQLSSIDRKPYSIEDCLRYFTREEPIDKEYLCNDCHREHYKNGGEYMLLTSATKQTLIFNPPAILTLHLKRFELKPGGSVKRADMITYGELLDIAPYCSSQCLRNNPPCRNIWYSLYGVVVHTGSLECGHYKAYVKVQRNKQLGVNRFLQKEYFDRDITKEDLIHMIQMTINEQSGKSSFASATDAVWYCANDSSVSETSLNTVLNQEAYLLFYERV